MSRKKNEIPMWAKTGHAKPVTRRDFLAAGIIPFTASLIMPQWLAILSNPAHAADGSIPLCDTASTDMPAVMILNLSGGAAMSGNYVPRKADGSLLPKYTKMGMGLTPTLTPAFNNASFISTSGILAGITANAIDTTRAKTAFAALCVRSQDDSSNNPFAIEGLLMKAGLVGGIMPQLQRGGPGHKYAITSPSAPLAVSRVADIASSLGYAGTLSANMTQKQREKLAKLIKNLSSEQSRRLASSSSGAQIKDLIECAGMKNESLNSGVPTGVSLADTSQTAADIRTIWGINPNDNNANAIYAAMTYNVLGGNAGAGTISLGGYDYHDNTRSTGDARDRQAGDVIGRMLQTAAVMNKKLFIYVTSDGSVVSGETDNAADARWSSDRGDAGCNYVMAFDPAGMPGNSGSQVGSFTDGQAVDGTHVIGNNTELAAAAAFANYLSFAKKLGSFQSAAAGRLTNAQLDEVVKITG